MDGSFEIGKLAGIPIKIHYTFFLIIPIFASSSEPRLN